MSTTAHNFEAAEASQAMCTDLWHQLCLGQVHKTPTFIYLIYYVIKVIICPCHVDECLLRETQSCAKARVR